MQDPPAVTLSKQMSGGVEYWRAQYRDAEGRKRSRGLGAVAKVTAREAERRRRAVEREVSGGATARAPTVEEWADQYWTIKPKASPGTRKAYRQSFALVVERWGRRRIDSITPADASRFARDLEERYTLQTARKHGRHGKALFGLAVKMRAIQSNPFAHETTAVPSRRRVGVDRDRWRYVTREEAERLMSGADEYVRVLVALARYGGLRASEALAIRGADYRDAESVIEVRIRDAAEAGTKQADREVPVSPRLAEIIGPIAKRRRGRLVPITYQVAHRRFVELRAAVGLDAWAKPFHAMRASACNDWARTPGVSIATAARWAGHSPGVFAARYHEEGADELAVITGGESDARARLVALVGMIPPDELERVERLARKAFGARLEQGTTGESSERP